MTNSASQITSTSSCSRSWSVSEDSLRRYVTYASERCIQELLSASETSRAGGGDGWKVLTFENGVEISKRRSSSLHVFRSRWLLQSVSPEQFIVVANAIDAAKIWWKQNTSGISPTTSASSDCGSATRRSLCSRRENSLSTSVERLWTTALWWSPWLLCPRRSPQDCSPRTATPFEGCCFSLAGWSRSLKMTLAWSPTLFSWILRVGCPSASSTG
ncbi:uncharacterized protein LOC122024803 isoform X2 [Zingiber officinale]|uniref:uncharacterized protein LOC122024803 isoform X2 n=1 Tax=Zingiber officinale TaxID=94328 RepID=UPI001C4BDF0C|nr:uncharacterized protein LOC122024803 isoform X2 [Zingiber officinale]